MRRHRPGDADGDRHRPGRIQVGYVGAPHGIELPIAEMFYRNVGVRGGERWYVYIWQSF